jgi:hypothetical protein
MLLPQGSSEKTIRKGGFRFLHKLFENFFNFFKIFNT